MPSNNTNSWLQPRSILCQQTRGGLEQKEIKDIKLTFLLVLLCGLIICFESNVSKGQTQIPLVTPKFSLAFIHPFLIPLTDTQINTCA